MREQISELLSGKSGGGSSGSGSESALVPASLEARFREVRAVCWSLHCARAHLHRRLEQSLVNPAVHAYV